LILEKPDWKLLKQVPISQYTKLIMILKPNSI